MTESIAEYLDRKIAESGLNGHQLAIKAGISPQYMNDIRKGRYRLTKPETIRAIAEVIATENGENAAVIETELFAAARRIPPDIEAWLTGGDAERLNRVRMLIEIGDK